MSPILGALDWTDPPQKSTPKPRYFGQAVSNFPGRLMSKHAYVGGWCRYFTCTKIVYLPGCGFIIEKVSLSQWDIQPQGEPQLQDELLVDTPPYVNPAVNMETEGTTENSGRANGAMITWMAAVIIVWGSEINEFWRKEILSCMHMLRYDSWSNHDFCWPQNSRNSRKVPRGEWNHEVPIIDSLVLFRNCKCSLNLGTPKKR